MLTIRTEQMEVLREIMSRRFEDRMVQHLKRCWPEECRELGDTGIRDSIHHGLRRCEHYGLASERDVARYLDLMYALGGDFDRAPDLGWAAAILGDRSLPAEERLDLLYARAERELSGSARQPGSNAGR